MEGLQKKVFDELLRQKKTKNTRVDGSFVVSISTVAEECHISTKRVHGMLFILSCMGEIELIDEDTGRRHITRAIIVKKVKEQPKVETPTVKKTLGGTIVRHSDGKRYLSDSNGDFYETSSNSSGSTYNLSNSFLKSLTVEESMEISKSQREYKTVRDRLEEKKRCLCSV